MKKMITAAILMIASIPAFAQVQFNPQIGLSFQDLTDASQSTNFRANAGYQLGVDLRFGDRLFFQPGAFIGRNSTYVDRVDADGNTALAFEQDLVTTNLKLRALAGYRIVDTYQFDIRFAAGPALNVLMSQDARGENVEFNKGDLSTGTLSIDAALGFDMGHLSLEPSVSFGLNRAFDDTPELSQFDSKYVTYGLTVGVNFGNDD